MIMVLTIGNKPITIMNTSMVSVTEIIAFVSKMSMF